MVDSMLREAIELAQEGRKTEARWVLQEILRDDVMNETAWLWYADCGETRGDRIQALETCIRHNPNASRARAALDLLSTGVETSYNSGMVAVTGGSGLEPIDPDPFVVEEFSAQADEIHESILADDLPFPELTEEQAFTRALPLTEADQWVLSGGASVFTVAPDTIPDKDFSDIETRTETFLESRPLIRPIQPRSPRRKLNGANGWDDLSKFSDEGRAATRDVKTRPTNITQRPRREMMAFALLTALVLLSLLVLVGAAILLNLG